MLLYAVNGCTSGVLPWAVAKLNWAVLTPLQKTSEKHPFIQNVNKHKYN